MRSFVTDQLLGAQRLDQGFRLPRWLHPELAFEGIAAAAVDVFDHWTAGNQREGFSGETSGVVSGRDNRNHPTVHGKPSGKDNWHEES